MDASPGVAGTWPVLLLLLVLLTVRIGLCLVVILLRILMLRVWMERSDLPPILGVLIWIIVVWELVFEERVVRGLLLMLRLLVVLWREISPIRPALELVVLIPVGLGSLSSGIWCLKSVTMRGVAGIVCCDPGLCL